MPFHKRRFWLLYDEVASAPPFKTEITGNPPEAKNGKEQLCGMSGCCVEKLFTGLWSLVI